MKKHNMNHFNTYNMKKAIIFFAVFTAGLWLGSEIDKEILLHECIQQTDGSDADCEECYYKIYGAYPTH
jgi:hypothetical protein